MKRYKDTVVDTRKIIGNGSFSSVIPPKLNWDVIEKQFVEGLGRDRVKREAIGMTLHFDLTRPKEFEQSSRFKQLAAQHNVPLFTLTPTKTSVEEFIPADTNLNRIIEVSKPD